MDQRILFPQPILPVKPQQPPASSKKEGTQGASFQDVLTQKLKEKELKFSAHSLQRLESRQVSLTKNQLERLNQGVEKAAAKGAKDSLVLMDNLAFVVSVKNKTVITAMDGLSMKENVFTNIDSAVIV